MACTPEGSVKLSDFKVLTFDCYGTLIDWESGMIAGLTPLTERLQPALARNEILEAHGRIEAMQQLATPSKPYAELLAVVAIDVRSQFNVHRQSLFPLLIRAIRHSPVLLRV